MTQAMSDESYGYLHYRVGELINIHFLLSSVITFLVVRDKDGVLSAF